MQQIQPMAGPARGAVQATRTAEVKLAKGQRFTLGHLRALVAECGDQADPASPVKADLFVRGGLRTLSVKVTSYADPGVAGG